MKVLLVDDDPVVRFLVGEYLTTKGHDVQIKNDGASALEAIASHQSNPDVVILDYMMPGMTGAEVLRDLRKTNALIPVVMLSADKENFNADTALANVTLEKPFALDALEETLFRVAGR